MSRVDEADDRQAAPRPLHQVPEQSSRIAACADQDDPARGGCPVRRGPDVSGDIQCVVHESSPIPGSRAPGRRHTPARSGFDLDVLFLISYVRVGMTPPRSFAQALRSTEPTLNMSYSEDIKELSSPAASGLWGGDRVNPSQARQTEESNGPEPRLTVIVVNYESWPDVVRLVESLTTEAEWLSRPLPGRGRGQRVSRPDPRGDLGDRVPA